jgi:hypothetical protein
MPEARFRRFLNPRWVVVAVATLIISTAAVALATDETYGDCTVRANKPWLTGEQHTYDTVNGSGRVFCGSKHTLELIVRLQEQDRLTNEWYVVASVKKGPRKTDSLYGEVSYGCAFRTSTSYRTRVVATIDGTQVAVNSTTTDC